MNFVQGLNPHNCLEKLYWSFVLIKYLFHVQKLLACTEMDVKKQGKSGLHIDFLNILCTGLTHKTQHSLANKIFKKVNNHEPRDI